MDLENGVVNKILATLKITFRRVKGDKGMVRQIININVNN